jgi:hypothetical protein
MMSSARRISPEYAAWAKPFRATVYVVLAVLAARVLYLLVACPYTLVEDEAFYWTWTRRPEWSYYSKGPGIAWLLWCFTKALGDTMLAVRLPAAIVSAATAIVLAKFTNEVVVMRGEGSGGAQDLKSRDARPGFFAACCFMLAPMFQVPAIVSTIDGPYALCYLGACWAAWRVFRTSAFVPSRLVLLALLLGVGFLFKYTILLLIPGLAAFAWWRWKTTSGAVATSPVRASENARSSTVVWSAAAGLLFVVCVAPVIVWNWTNHWPTLSHLLGHAGLPGGDTAAKSWSYSPLWTLEYVAVQLLALGPASLLIVLGIVRARHHWKSDPQRRARDYFLMACGLPPYVFYLLYTIVGKAQANWAIAGSLPLLTFAGMVLVRGLDEWKQDVVEWHGRPKERQVRESLLRKEGESLVHFFWNATAVVGVVSGLCLLRLDVVSSVLESLKTTPLVRGVIPAKATISLGRFTGADRMGEHAGELLARLAERRPQKPFVLTPHYGRAAHLEFYMPGQPTVYCVSAFVAGGRRSQYDYWQGTDLRGAMHLLGKDALIVGGYRVEDWQPYFEKVELLGRLDGDGKPDRPAFYGYGYRGVEAAMTTLRNNPQPTSKPQAVYPSAPRAIPASDVPASPGASPDTPPESLGRGRGS